MKSKYDTHIVLYHNEKARKDKAKQLLGIYPTLYGDGSTDDTEALQSMFNGLIVLDQKGNRVRCTDGYCEYKISKEVRLPYDYLTDTAFSYENTPSFGGTVKLQECRVTGDILIKPVGVCK